MNSLDLAIYNKKNIKKYKIFDNFYAFFFFFTASEYYINAVSFKVSDTYAE